MLILPLVHDRVIQVEKIKVETIRGLLSMRFHGTTECPAGRIENLIIQSSYTEALEVPH